jgi:hypothetical protein
MSAANKELSMKVVQGRGARSKRSIWQRFDRLQRSVAPLRKAKRMKRGLYYGNGS